MNFPTFYKENSKNSSRKIASTVTCVPYDIQSSEQNCTKCDNCFRFTFYKENSKNSSRKIASPLLRVGRLAGEDRVQMVPLDGCPEQTIFDNVSGVLFDLIIHQIIVDEPEHIGLRSA
uniref:Uncharacterized protein n=1 Tax=Anopheles maculatus TaxID=74869 RepID=A0A182S7Y8_9DIPT